MFDLRYGFNFKLHWFNFNEIYLSAYAHPPNQIAIIAHEQKAKLNNCVYALWVGRPACFACVSVSVCVYVWFFHGCKISKHAEMLRQIQQSQRQSYLLIGF